MNFAASSQPFRLIVTGGGTGGHTYPALTTVRTLQQRLAGQGRSLETLWVGQADSLESRIAAAEQIAFRSVVVGKIRRSSNPLKMMSPTNIRDMSNVPRGVMQARSIIAKFQPDVVLGTGGYVAVPVGLAAKSSRKPLVVHEQTVRLGLANRLLAPRATTVAVSSESSVELLPEAARGKAVVTGNPVRPEVLAGRADRAPGALGFTGYDSRLPTVYVTGGAAGAVQINTLVAEILPWLLDNANVIHQCGPNNVATMNETAARLSPAARARYHLTGYMGAELPDVLALTDVMVSRSGAGTIAELTAIGKASVLVPYPSAAGNEQEHNARHLHDSGAAVALPKTATAEQLSTALAPLLADPRARAAMAANARAHGRPDAADRLTDVVLAAAATA